MLCTEIAISIIKTRNVKLKNNITMTTLVKTNGNGRNVFFPEFPSLFDDLFTRDFVNLHHKYNRLPAVNVKETEAEYNLELALPGMDKKDFKLELNQNVLTVSSHKEEKSEEKNENGKYVRKEFSYQSFSRSFTLPEKGIDVTNISANYVNGVLSIHVPKKEKEQTSNVREIEVL